MQSSDLIMLVVGPLIVVVYAYMRQYSGQKKDRTPGASSENHGTIDASSGSDTGFLGDVKAADFSWAPSHHGGASGDFGGGHHGGSSGDFGGDSGGGHH